MGKPNPPEEQNKALNRENSLLWLTKGRIDPELCVECDECRQTADLMLFQQEKYKVDLLWKDVEF